MKLSKSTLIAASTLALESSCIDPNITCAQLDDEITKTRTRELPPAGSFEGDGTREFGKQTRIRILETVKIEKGYE